MKIWKMGCALVLVLAAGSAASAQLATPIHATFAPLNDVPGVPGRTFTSISDFSGSSSGTRWVFRAVITGEAATNQVIVAGLGGDAGETRIQKGALLPADVGPRTINIPNAPHINDSGQILVSTNSSGGAGTSPALYLIRDDGDGSGLVRVASNADSVPGLVGATYATLRSTGMLNDGRAVFESTISQTGVTGNDGALFAGSTLVARANSEDFAPERLPDTFPTDATWQNFTINRFRPVNPEGTSFIWVGRDNGSPAVDLAVIDNVAVLEESGFVPGNLGIGQVSSITGSWADGGGNWFVRAVAGTGAGGTDFVLRNGDVIMQRGQPIVPGSDLVWDRQNATTTASGVRFQIGSPDGNDYYVGGWALDTVGGSRTEVVVKNGTEIVLQVGDRVDLDGNGEDDDGAFINAFVSETGTGVAKIGSDGALYVLAMVRADGAGSDLGRALLRFGGDSVEPCLADFNNSGTVTVDDIFAFLSAWFAGDPSADINDSGTITVDDIFAFLSLWFAGCD